MTKKIILITGASGEIGENLIQYFSKKKEYKVIALDLNPPLNGIKNHKFYQGSIMDDGLLNKINNKYTFDEVYHLAAILSTKAEANPKHAEEINVQGTIKIFELVQHQSLKQNKRIKLFFPSSIAIYNIKKNSDKNKLINELMFCNPKTVYGKNKLFCENLGTAFDKFGNQNKIHIDFRCIRFPGIISSNTYPTGGTSDYVPEMIFAAKKSQPYSCFVEQNSKIPFIVMPDAINAIIKIMSCDKKQLKNHVYNITSFSPSVEEFHNEIISYFNKFILTYDINNQRQKIINSWPGLLDDSIARKDWDWKPEFNFKNAFKKYLFL